MATILQEIVAAKQRQLIEQKQRWPLEMLQQDLPKSDRDFLGALRAVRPAFILECKKASPSKGLIRPDFDLRAIALEYSRFASAISVLTEPEYFHGSLEFLSEIRKIAPQPLLCKDFFIDRWQVFAARYFGADAILLMLSILDNEQFRSLAQLANELGMGVLTEVSNSIEQARAIRLGARIVGINNRNLRDMSIDLSTTVTLAEGLPKDVLVVSESGYDANYQLRDNSHVANGFLVGSSLMATTDLHAAVKSLIFGDHKVCGLTDVNSAKAADDAGAVYGGVIFAENSPRCVSFDEAREILDATRLVRVGVFQNQSIEFIEEAIHEVLLNVVQLHGVEDAEFAKQLVQTLPSTIRVWKALSVNQLDMADEFFTSGIDRMVVDHQTAAAAGGTGTCFDWKQLPRRNRDKMMIAGGLNFDNVSSALDLRAAGLDFNSSLESIPGKKSPELIRELFKRIRVY